MEPLKILHINHKSDTETTKASEAFDYNRFEFRIYGILIIVCFDSTENGMFAIKVYAHEKTLINQTFRFNL